VKTQKWCEESKWRDRRKSARLYAGSKRKKKKKIAEKERETHNNALFTDMGAGWKIRRMSACVAWKMEEEDDGDDFIWRREISKSAISIR